MTTKDESSVALRPVAWVTGSSSGIGRAISIQLALAGFDLVIHGRVNREGAEDTLRRITDLGAAGIIVMADLSQQGEREAALEEACSWKGVPHVLVNNAGADVLTGQVKHWSFEQKLQRLWETDVTATVSLSRSIALRMKAADRELDSDQLRSIVATVGVPCRCIVNIGWDQAEFGMEGDSGEMFATIKGAIMAFTRSLARSLAPQIRVNCVAPGWIQTLWGESAEGYWDQRAKQEALLGRWGKPEDVAAAVAFLSSPAGQFVNGQVLPVNGGFTGNQR